MLGALSVGVLLALMMGYVVLILVMGKGDNYAQPYMIVVSCLTLVLGVGLVRGGSRGEKP
jgi:hypothetical protein